MRNLRKVPRKVHSVISTISIYQPPSLGCTSSTVVHHKTQWWCHGWSPMWSTNSCLVQWLKDLTLRCRDSVHGIAVKFPSRSISCSGRATWSWWINVRVCTSMRSGIIVKNASIVGKSKPQKHIVVVIDEANTWTHVPHCLLLYKARFLHPGTFWKTCLKSK